MPYPPQGAGTLGSQRYQASASNDIIVSMDTARSFTATSYALLKQAKINFFGVIRTYFELAVSGSAIIAYGRVYRNGSPVGTERNTMSTSYVAFTEDIGGWMEGDLYQLYTYQVSSSLGTYGLARNFRAMGKIQTIVSPTTARVEID